jgi:hypothetical protein
MLAAAIMRFVVGGLWFSPFAFAEPRRRRVGFFNWLGFIAAIQFTTALYQQRPPKPFAVQSGFNLLSLLLMGARLAVWR